MAKVVHFLFVALLFFASSELGKGQKRLREAKKKILDDLLSSYDKRIRPNNVNETDFESKPVHIVVNFFVRNVEEINDKKGEWRVQLTFRQTWTDERLKFNDYNGQIRYINMIDGESQIWKPDTFFRNEKESHVHKLLAPNQLIRIHPDGNVLYSTRITLTLSCPMDFKYYPFDEQVCQISLASYGHTTEDVVYLWKESDPIQVSMGLYLPKFTFKKSLSDYCTSKTNTGSYSCVQASFLFKREFNYYLIQIYIPCAMLVLVSFVGFWMDGKKDLTARTIIVLGSLLTMACMTSLMNTRMPSVSYTKRIDVWTGVSLTFVFAALLELATVNYLAKQENISSESRQYKMIQAMKKINCHKLDVICRIVFPALYLLFTIIYCIDVCFLAP